MKQIMQKINDQKELLIFHKEKVEQMIKAVVESSTQTELVDKFFVAFADMNEASNALKKNSLHLLVDRFRDLVN